MLVLLVLVLLVLLLLLLRLTRPAPPPLTNSPGPLRYLEDLPVPVEVLSAAIRRATISLDLVPVYMGSAYKNKGVQPLLDGVTTFLPAPTEVPNFAVDLDDDEKPVAIACDPNLPLLALAFKLEESQFGQLTYMRVYQVRAPLLPLLRFSSTSPTLDGSPLSLALSLGHHQARGDHLPR